LKNLIFPRIEKLIFDHGIFGRETISLLITCVKNLKSKRSTIKIPNLPTCVVVRNKHETITLCLTLTPSLRLKNCYSTMKCLAQDHLYVDNIYEKFQGQKMHSKKIIQNLHLLQPLNKNPNVFSSIIASNKKPVFSTITPPSQKPNSFHPLLSFNKNLTIYHLLLPFQPKSTNISFIMLLDKNPSFCIHYSPLDQNLQIFYLIHAPSKKSQHFSFIVSIIYQPKL